MLPQVQAAAVYGLLPMAIAAALVSDHGEMTRCGVFTGLFGYIQGFPTRPKREPCGALIAFLSPVRYPAYGGVCLPQRLSVHLLELPKNPQPPTHCPMAATL